MPAVEQDLSWTPLQQVLFALPSTSLPKELQLLQQKKETDWTITDARLAYFSYQHHLRDIVEEEGWDADLLHLPPLQENVSVGVLLASPTILAIILPSEHNTNSTQQSLQKLSAQQVGKQEWHLPLQRSIVDGLREIVTRLTLPVTPAAAASLRKINQNPETNTELNSTQATPLPSVALQPKKPSTPIAPDPANGIVRFNQRGTIVIQAEPSKPLVAELTRVMGLRWNDAEKAWLAPQSKLSEIVRIAETFGIPLEPEVAKKIEYLTRPFNYDGTLSGLRQLPLTTLACMDEKKAERFAEFGVNTIFDLLMLIPRRYIDRSNVQHIRDLTPGMDAAFLATISNINVDPRRRMVRFDVTDGTGKIGLTYFNALWQAKRFRTGDTVIVNGKVDEWVGATKRSLQMANPMMDPLTEETLPIIPIYPQSAKTRVSTWDIHQAVKETLQRLGHPLYDPMPQFIKDEHGFIDRHEAIHIMHLPNTVSQTSSARNRLAFDELLCLQSSVLLSKYGMEKEDGIAHKITGEITGQLISSLPFSLTGAQQRVWGEIQEGLTRSHPLHRLLQGDVGAGKTFVALLTLLTGVESGYQGALMAPTEILATQLYNEIVERTEGILDSKGDPIRIVLLTNKLRGKARTAALAELAEGRTHIAVGTHALIVGDVEFKNLGIVVVDEQHRFGVEQRAALRAKGAQGMRPDMLVMTATPIPRTAAMTVFGDLDVSILDELPPGRTPIVTRWLDEVPNLDVLLGDPWETVRREILKGHQAYVVCPLVEESEKLQVANATETYESLASGALSEFKLGLVHGQQKPEERSEIMSAFRQGELDVLVATTVIEVGVNVPNSTVIVILDAGRFGIAQLHQLRGRVGRGAAASECLLVGRCMSTESRTRMQALCDSTDGFYLSEVDLELRGPGSVFGTQQSGMSDLKVADLGQDKELLVVAREAAEKALERDPGYSNSPELRAEIKAMLGEHADSWLGKS